MSKYRFLTFLIVPLLLMSCQPTPTALQRLTDAEKERIVAFKDIHVKAMLSHDPVRATATFAEDAILLPPNGKMIRGIAEVEKFFQASMQQEMTELTLTPVEIHGYHDLAYVVGTAEIRMAPSTGTSEGEPFPALAKFTWILKRQTDDSWKIAVDVWNSAPSLEGLVD